MPEDMPVPQSNPPVPVPDSSRPIIIPPEPSKPIEIDEPPPSEPAFPIREPGMQRQPQIVSCQYKWTNLHSVSAGQERWFSAVDIHPSSWPGNWGGPLRVAATHTLRSHQTSTAILLLPVAAGSV